MSQCLLARTNNRNLEVRRGRGQKVKGSFESNRLGPGKREVEMDTTAEE